MKIITLLTDFGSFYPAQMKGVILSRLADNARDVTFVDIAHDTPPQDVRAGAFALLSTARYFPPGTIHIAVVDPGVGTERLGLVVESDGLIFVGPDNGLLLPAAKSLGTPGNPPQAYKIASFEALG
jgi:S-adenosyl-L-methionine hydrolase (adenosine-forming)